MQLQTQLMNLAFYRLSMDVQKDSLGLRLSLAGTSLIRSLAGSVPTGRPAGMEVFVIN